MKRLFLLFTLFLATIACAFSGQSHPTQDVSSIVNATLTAVAQSNPANVPPQPTSAQNNPTDQATQGPPQDNIPPLGTVTGTLTYPASTLPPMRVAFFNLADGSVSYIDTALGQNAYSSDLPEGTYHVVSYSLGGTGFPSGLAGGYTQAVLCGLTAECTDHSLLPIIVITGETVTADPADWYALDGTFPPMPSP